MTGRPDQTRPIIEPANRTLLNISGHKLVPATGTLPEMVSSHSDRPIRPLPKKPLRERLSPDVAKTIKYPSPPNSVPSLFYYGHNTIPELDKGNRNSLPPSNEIDTAESPSGMERRGGEVSESEDEEVTYRDRLFSRPLADSSGRSFRYVQKPESTTSNSKPPTSTSSSIDGYDSFENTNNKKKRKIPTHGDSNLSAGHMNGDLAFWRVANHDDATEDLRGGGRTSHDSTDVLQGTSGPGRGRYGRNRNGRSPLRTLTDVSSNWGNGRTKPRQLQPKTTTEKTHIISESIASAHAQKAPLEFSKGQENVSIMQSQAARRSTPASAQFTFTCDSQVSTTLPVGNSMIMPRSDLGSGASIPPDASKKSLHHPTSIRGSTGTGQAQKNIDTSSKVLHSQKPVPLPPVVTRKARQRSAAKDYLIAARQRREQQKWQNEHHPLPGEEQWTCEFCEYEQIFGSPPIALIKQYEIKDRQARKQEAERRRLLEKAKSRGRKGKKGNKVTCKAVSTSQQPSHDLQPNTQDFGQIENQAANSDGQPERGTEPQLQSFPDTGDSCDATTYSPTDGSIKTGLSRDNRS